MVRYAGGSAVESGYYLNTRSYAVVTLPADGRLPGAPGEAFVRVPWPVLLAAAPIVGGAFVLAYPVIGLSTMAYGLARKVLGAAGQGAGELASTMAPGPLPGEAHLTGQPGEGEPVEGSDLKDLEAEIGKARDHRQPHP
jgi:hypothetical protein